MNQTVKYVVNKSELLYCPFCIPVFSLRGPHYRNCAKALLFSLPKLFILQKAAKQKWGSLDFFFEAKVAQMESSDLPWLPKYQGQGQKHKKKAVH